MAFLLGCLEGKFTRHFASLLLSSFRMCTQNIEINFFVTFIQHPYLTLQIIFYDVKILFCGLALSFFPRLESKSYATADVTTKFMKTPFLAFFTNVSHKNSKIWNLNSNCVNTGAQHIGVDDECV